MTGRDDFLAELAETGEALREQAKADEDRRRDEEEAARPLLAAREAQRERREEMLQERAKTAIQDAANTAEYLKKDDEEKVGVMPDQTVPREGGAGAVDLWFIDFTEVGIRKDPPPDGTDSWRSDDKIYEGTYIHVYGLGLDASGRLHSLTGEYEIEEEYRTDLGGAEDERRAKRQMFAVPLDASGMREVLVGLMPKRPQQQDWPTFELDSSGRRVHSRIRTLPEEADEDYEARLDKALHAWHEKLLGLVKANWQPRKT